MLAPSSSLSQEKEGYGKKSNRTIISKEAKQLLEQHFAIDPYPAWVGIEMLARRTNLANRNIQMWFANTRSRRGKSKSKTSSVDLNSIRSTSTLPPTPSNTTVVSDASLELLNSVSTSRSPSPLAILLSTPTKGGSVSVTAPEATIQFAPPTKPVSTTCFTALPTPQRDHSITQSDNTSKLLADSMQSCSNVGSADHRGSRRGRKRLSQPHPINHTSLQMEFDSNYMDPPPNSADASRKRSAREFEGDENAFYCTWPSCNKSFLNRSNWARHEEAVHHCPISWICCYKDEWPCLVCHEGNHGTLHHFASCAPKDIQSRTFLREDHLTKHIQRTHINSDIPEFEISKQLLTSWKVDNASFSEESLRCGFCGILLETWKQRQDHVWGHLKAGICKSAWWPQRLAPPSNIYHIFRCEPCGSIFKDALEAATSHAMCRTWSCRYLHNGRSIISPASSCRLCPLLDPPLWPHTGRMGEVELCHPLAAVHRHDPNFHNLRGCDQVVYTSVDAFVKHLRDDHNAWFPRSEPDLGPWQRVQVLEFPSVQETVHPYQHTISHACCAVLDRAHNLATIYVDN
ncbi:hypothetical protein DE146DRAFT_615712 [Phaeosphaeria sp. MPI-PUGE-AT-0046c]|nr:hypothetical protein DE146DRAFT_615712 [Phaeosphaeria sp. MPI-PUGE-AT-0046c]